MTCATEVLHTLKRLVVKQSVHQWNALLKSVSGRLPKLGALHRRDKNSR